MGGSALTNTSGRTVSRFCRRRQGPLLKQPDHSAGTAFQWCGRASRVVSVAWRVARCGLPLVLWLKLCERHSFCKATRCRSHCPSDTTATVRIMHSTRGVVQLDPFIHYSSVGQWARSDMYMYLQ